MKTPMQEVYKNFNLMSDSDFKSWMLNTDLLKKEKEVIMTAHYAPTYGCFSENYYNETFKTKEK